jgi:hypothetical protein
MSVLSNNLDTKSYTLYISSTDKISGTNNNANFQINWVDFLPTKHKEYKMTFSFQSGGGNYKDTNSTCQCTYVAGSNILTISNLQAGGIISVNSYFTLLNGLNLNGIPSGTYIIGYLTGNYNAAGTFYMSNNATATNAVPQWIYTNLSYSGCKIIMNSLSSSFSYDTSTKSKSYTLGYAQRDIQSSSSTSNSFSTFYLQFPPKTMIRPSENFINISIYNINNNILLTDSNISGYTYADMTSWNLILEFTPINDTQ